MVFGRLHPFGASVVIILYKLRIASQSYGALLYVAHTHIIKK